MKQSSVVFVFVTATFLLLLVSCSKDKARNLQGGVTIEQVHELLGSPDLEFRSPGEIAKTYLISFRFRRISGNATNTKPDDKLPTVDQDSEWFGDKSSGYMIFYDEDQKVESVFWGGT